MIALSAKDTSVEIPAVVVTAAEHQQLGAFLRPYTRRRKARGGKPEGVEFTLYEFAEGLVHQSGSQPEKAIAFPWRKAVRVYLSGHQLSGGGSSLISYAYLLETVGGGSLTVQGSFDTASFSIRHIKPPNMERDLYSMLSRSQLTVSQHLLPLARKALAEGKKVLFNEVKVSRAGLHTDVGLIPWPTITSIKVTDGSLVVRVAGRSRLRPALRLPMSQIPNGPLLMALVTDLREGR